MPDANDRIIPTFYSLTAARHAEIFGPEDEPELDIEEPEWDIVWTPDPSLDGAHFTPDQ